MTPDLPPAVDELVRELGALLSARQALAVADEATACAITKAVHDAGVAVSRTIGHGDEVGLLGAAKDAIAVARHTLDFIDQERTRSRELTLESLLLRERAAQLLLESVAQHERSRRIRRRD